MSIVLAPFVACSTACSGDTMAGGQDVDPVASSTDASNTDTLNTDTLDDATATATVGTTDAQTDVALSFVLHIQPVFDVNCVSGCHVSGGEWPFLDLSDDAYEDIVGRPGVTQARRHKLIDPGAPARSYLWAKLNNDVAFPDFFGRPMPYTGLNEPFVPLAARDLATVERWIREGASP